MPVFQSKKRRCQATWKVSLTAKRQILLDHRSIPFLLNICCVWLELVKLAKALLFFPQTQMNDVRKQSLTLAIKYTTNTARWSKWHQSGTASLTTMSLILRHTEDFSWKFGPLFQVSVGPAVQIHKKERKLGDGRNPPRTRRCNRMCLLETLRQVAFG